jgi:outer membrane biosynthesis protein TonB
LGLGSTPQAERATREAYDGTYRDALTKKARAHARYFRSENRERRLEAEFLVKQSPSGEVVSVEKIQESGDPKYDRAIWEGILRASPFPKKKDGTVEGEVKLKFIEN